MARAMGIEFMNNLGVGMKLDLREQVAKAQGSKDEVYLENGEMLVWLGLWTIRGEELH